MLEFLDKFVGWRRNTSLLNHSYRSSWCCNHVYNYNNNNNKMSLARIRFCRVFCFKTNCILLDKRVGFTNLLCIAFAINSTGLGRTLFMSLRITGHTCSVQRVVTVPCSRRPWCLSCGGTPQARAALAVGRRRHLRRAPHHEVASGHTHH